jgi:excisionase family DNA binding protein
MLLGTLVDYRTQAYYNRHKHGLGGQLMPEDEEMLTVEEVAKLLRVGEKTVRRWINNGDLIAIDVGRGYRITRSNYEDFKRRRETGRKDT